MSEPNPDAWAESTSGRERVRLVVEWLEAPATVAEIADAADVAWETASSELERMTAENQAREYEEDGQTTYGPNPVRQFLDQVLDLIEENDREELETELVEYQTRLESLQEEHDADSVDEFRQRLTGDDRTAAEMREIRNTVSTWEALETERRLLRRALDLYDDVSRLSGPGDGPDVLAA